MIKRNCNSCKALEFGIIVNCSLGYHNVPSIIKQNVVMEFKPTELCPKPKTNKQLTEAIENLNETRS